MKNILVLAFFVLTSCGSSTPPPTIPETGAYIGGILLSDQTTIEDFNNNTGAKHALFMRFIKFPEVLDPTSPWYQAINDFVKACKSANAIPIIAIMTESGLSSYTKDQITDLANILVGFDVPIFLRWNHEMNGSWYIWSQQPTLYIEKFREFADIIHKKASNVAMVWTPNQGAGYPWVASGPYYNSTPSVDDLALLDTNKDGVFNWLDDPYSPYYPGDDYVDWVGHSYYHWGTTRGKNEVPVAGEWTEANGIGGTVPNFHDIYAVGHNKPMMIAETSALYDPSDAMGGATESSIKKEWIGQVYDLSPFPRIKAILWFSELKYEDEVSTDIDWRLDTSKEVADYYKTIVADPYFIKAQ